MNNATSGPCSPDFHCSVMRTLPEATWARLTPILSSACPRTNAHALYAPRNRVSRILRNVAACRSRRLISASTAAAIPPSQICRYRKQGFPTRTLTFSELTL
jgi:hypothetical protein